MRTEENTAAIVTIVKIEEKNITALMHFYWLLVFGKIGQK
jgi:hypothetical protein